MHIEAKTTETKNRLREIKQVLLYPNNQSKIAESIEKILNDIPADRPMPKRLPKGKQGVQKIISEAEFESEQEKTAKILHQIELVMKVKKLLATQEPPIVLGGAKRLAAKENL